MATHAYTGTILSWDMSRQSGLIEESFSGYIFNFIAKHSIDAAVLVKGMRVTYELTPSSVPVNIQSASAAFRRLADLYNPDAKDHELVSFLKQRCIKVNSLVLTRVLTIVSKV